MEVGGCIQIALTRKRVTTIVQISRVWSKIESCNRMALLHWEITNEQMACDQLMYNIIWNSRSLLSSSSLES